MKLTIHDVGHGACVSFVHRNGNVMLWDCGHKDNYRPSSFLPRLDVREVEYFFVTNYDEDHISDLPNLREAVHLKSMYRNKSISADDLRTLKRQGGPISSAMESMLDMINTYTGGPLDPAPDFSGARFKTFYNHYGGEFPDTNNISLVTFFECGGTKFVIPGDLEKDGWLGLLRKQEFVNELGGVNVFLSSHHGRENGYCEEVFKICAPDVFVSSDSEIKHATQEMSQLYVQHANGIQFNGETRYVLTTRNDGSLTWSF
ncbi:MAG: ComEC/Rec2 family competence protein [Nitrospiria bacterium]